MRRFTADGWEPNLRISQEQRPVAEPCSLYFDNKLNAPKKDGEVRERNYPTGIAQHWQRVKDANRTSYKEERSLRTIGFVPRARVYNPNPCNSYETD